MRPDPTGRPPLDRDRIARSAAPGLAVEIVAEAASTNALVAERAHVGAADGLVVVAEHQTAGRGRLDRTWESPARAGLTFSLLLRPDAPAADWPWLPLVAGHAVSQALLDAGHDASLKWPNDVLVGGRKVAGILVERVETATGPAAVVGIGLNVSTTAEELPVPEATSLALARPDPAPDRTDVLLGLLAALRRECWDWRAAARSYAASCATVGSRVRVLLPSGSELLGTAVGLDDHGRLLVESGSGTTAVSAGDVVHVRVP